MIFLLPNDTIGQLSVGEVFVYYDIPRLFVAESPSGQKFLVNCLDSDDASDTWILSAVSERRLFSLKDGNLSLIEAFTTPELGYLTEIVAEHSGSVVKSRRRTPEDLSAAELPDAGVTLSAVYEEDSNRPNAAFLARTLNSNIVLLDLYPKQIKKEAPAKVVGKVLSTFEDYVSIKLGRLNLPAFQVNMVGTYQSSFGIEIAVRGEDERIAEVLKDAVRELGKAEKTDSFESEMVGVEDQEVDAMRKFLSELKHAKSDLKLETSSKSDLESTVASVPLVKVREAIKKLKRTAVIRLDNRRVEGELVGLSLTSHRFELIDKRLGIVYKGSVAADVFNKVKTAVLPSLYRAVLEGGVRKEVNGKEGVSSWKMIAATRIGE
jgi:hypothetical protein